MEPSGAQQLPHHYEFLRPYIESVWRDSPYERNVFVMVRYANSPQLDAIRAAVCDSLVDHGFTPLIAADKSYHPHLWENICVCMLASRFGLAVFEDIVERHHNPNIAIELGFMTALGRRCLPLKETHMPALPVDIGGVIYEEFDCYNIQSTINAAIKKWVEKDLNEGLRLAENLEGHYESEWRFGAGAPNIGTAQIEGSGNEIRIIVRDSRASAYAVTGRLIGAREITASWFNLDYEGDYGSWKATVSEDLEVLEGQWTSSVDDSRGTWHLRRARASRAASEPEAAVVAMGVEVAALADAPAMVESDDFPGTDAAAVPRLRKRGAPKRPRSRPRKSAKRAKVGNRRATKKKAGKKSVAKKRAKKGLSGKKRPSFKGVRAGEGRIRARPSKASNEREGREADEPD